MTAILGTVGFGGLALGITMYLILGLRGKGKIKCDVDNAPIWGFVAGVLYSLAGGSWSAADTAGKAFSTAFASPGASVGNIGPAGVALVLVLFVYGTKPRPFVDSVCGIVAPSLFLAAGGLWALPVTVLTGFISSMVH